MKYKAIIFDFFGVISSNTAPNWFENHFPNTDNKKLKEKYFIPADAGQMTEEELLENLATISQTTPKEVSEEIQSYAVINKELIQFILELKKEYKIGICTNAVSGFFRSILKDNDIENLFDVIIVSSEIGISKPHPEIYFKTLESLGAIPSETIMIDDTLENITAANEVGIKGLLFVSNEKLKEDFANL